MRLPLAYRITKWTDLSLEEVDAIFQNGTSDSYSLFPKTIMNGTMATGRIDALINPPKLIVDPFKSRVRGELKKVYDLTKIDLRIDLSWVIIVFGVLWYIPIIIGFSGLFANELGHEIERIIGLTIFSILPIGFSAFKLHFDKVRLENWIEEKITTVHISTEKRKN